MNTKQQAAEQLINFIAQFQGVLDLAGELKRIGDLEAHEQEILGRIALHETSAEKAQAQALQCQSDADAMSGTAEEILEKAKAEASRLSAQAADQAQSVLSAANQRASAMVNEAVAAKAVIDQKVAQASATHTELQQAILVTELKHRNLKNDLAELAKRLGN